VRSRLEIVHVSEAIERELIDLFDEMAADSASGYFHPHPFDTESARRIARYQGKDLYCAARDEHGLLAYGMLRGWDEGYDVPSLGLYVSGPVRGAGIGSLMMVYLHAAARLRGCRSVRLTVNADNAFARSLYEKCGYVFRNESPERLVGTVSLGRGRTAGAPRARDL